jgi:hypothetical protein
MITHEEEKWGFIPHAFKSEFEGHGHAYPTLSRLACERSGILSNLMGAIVLLRGCGRIQLITRLRMQRPIAYKLMSCTTLTVPFR